MSHRPKTPDIVKAKKHEGERPHWQVIREEGKWKEGDVGNENGESLGNDGHGADSKYGLWGQWEEERKSCNINEQCAPTDPATNHVQVPSTDPIYWTHFITEFNSAYADSAEKQNVAAELHCIHMQGIDLDSYVTRFWTLAAKSEYGLNEEGTLNLFQWGLPDAFEKTIISKHNPQTWHEWENAAHIKHNVWLRLSSLYPKKQEKTKFERTESVLQFSLLQWLIGSLRDS